MQKTTLRYAGGKSRAIKKITPFVEEYDEIISPFLGGGSLETHWASSGKSVLAYDIFDILINFWEVILSDPSALADELSNIIPTASEYKRIKDSLICTPQVQHMLKDWKTNFYVCDHEIPLDKITLAAYYYFNHNCSYGPGFLGWASKIYMNQEKWDRTVEKVRNFKCPTLRVEVGSFELPFAKHPDKFFYLDPPYYIKKDSDNKMLGGIYPMKNIPVHHSSFDHQLLRDLLEKHSGDFVMSYNNCETIRNWYKDYDFYFPEWHYSMDIGEKRIGENRKKRIGGNLEEVQRLEEMIINLEQAETKDKSQIAKLKTEKHEILKKKSHEILIVKKVDRSV